MKFIALACAITTLLVTSTQAQEPTDVTLVRLIANPEKFDGQLIRVVGFLRSNLKGTYFISIGKTTRMPYWGMVFGWTLRPRSRSRALL